MVYYAYMGDGASGSGGLSGVLFEAGKTISDAGKQQAQQTAQSVFSSVTGSQKQLFSKPQSGSFTPKQTSQGQTPQLDPFGNLGKMFESGGLKSPIAAKSPVVGAASEITQQELAQMAAENQVRDQEEIAKREAELAQIKAQAHKARHDEVYYDAIRNAGKTIAQERQEKQRQEEEEALAKEQEAQTNQLNALPGTPLFQNQQLGQPVSVQQAMTKTEAQRGSTG